MRPIMLALACGLVWTSSAAAQEFKAILSSDDFRPGKEITLTIEGGTPPFSLFFGSGFFREEQLLLKVTSPDDRKYRLTVTEALDPAHAQWRTITIEDSTGREVLARAMPAQPPSQPKDNGLAKLTADLKSPNELVRLQAAKKLGMLGAVARPALPDLQGLLNDPDEDVRLVAAASIRRIEGEWGTEWVKMTLPDHRFEIQFPASPKVSQIEPSTKDIWKVDVTGQGWELSRRNPDQGVGLMVITVLPPNRVSAQPARFWFDSFQQYVLSKDATTLLASRDFKVADKYAARVVEFKVANDEWRGRPSLVLTSSAIYVIFAGGSAEFLASDVVKRFTESFKTWDEPAQEPPTGADRVQALIRRLQSPEAFDRLFALRALEKLGAEARDAIPHVEKLANEGTTEERPYAQHVLEGLRRAGGTAAPGSLTGTTWVGAESLPGFTKLSFQFEPDGKVVRVDTFATNNGTWTQNGAQVTITFGNTIYTGTIQDQVLSGNVHRGRDNWKFSVTRR